MAVYSAAKRYWWFTTEGTPKTLNTTSPIYLRNRRESSTAVWVENTQEEEVTTGDFFTTQDAIPNNPHAEITIVTEFFPTILKALLANCCLAPGSGVNPGPLLPPVSMSMGVGNGLDEDQYAGVQFVGGQLVVGTPCLWTLRFIGSEKPGQAAAKASSAVVLPAWERPYRRSNLSPATLPGSAAALSENKFRNLAIDIICQNTPLYDSRGDSIDGISDMVLDKLGANASFDRAYSTATEKAAFLAECGTDGPMDFSFLTLCGTKTTTHTFHWPRARYTAESLTAAQNDQIREPLAVSGLRPSTSDTNTAYSPLQYNYSSI